MKFQSVHFLPFRENIYDAKIISDNWILRSNQSITAISQSNFKIKWQFEFENESYSGIKSLNSLGNDIYTFSDYGKEGSILYSIDAISGKKNWSKKIDYRILENGIVSKKDHLYLLTSHPEHGFQVIKLSTTESSQVLEIHNIPPSNKIKSISNLLFIASNNGLIQINIEDFKTQKFLSSTPVYDFKIELDKIYLFTTKEIDSNWVYIMSMFLLKNRNQVTEIEVNTDWEFINFRPLNHKNEIIFCRGKNKGLSYLNINNNLNSFFLLNGEPFTGLKLNIEENILIVFAENSNNENQVFTLDLKSGKTIQKLKSKVSPNNIFYKDQQLILTGFKGIEFFNFN